MSDLRERASMSHKRDTSSHVVNLDIIFPGIITGRLPSPIPSLHDPEKAKRFGEECEALLTNKDFEKDFLSPSAVLSRPATSSSAQRKGSDNFELSTEASAAQIDETPQQASGNTLDSQGNVLAGPKPPIRMSSKGGARPATIVQITKPVCMPVLKGFKDGALIVPDDASEHAALHDASPRPRLSRIPLRMASGTSTATEAENSPRPGKSTDTLTLIEAQVRITPQHGLAERPKKRIGASPVQNKQLGPSGTPPERPLPELPTDSTSNLSKTSPRSCTIPSDRHSNPVQVSPSTEIASTTDTEDTSLRSPKQGLVPIFNLKDPLVRPAEGHVDNEQGPATLASAYSQSSLVSDSLTKHKYARHDKSRFRAGRMKELRRRVKADLERQIRISEERDDSEEEHRATSIPNISKAHLTSGQDIKQQPSLDQLGQFPVVPASRPASRTSHHGDPSLRADSRTRGHVRQQSKASSRLSHRPAMLWPAKRQILGTSQIKVLVDTDPVTGRFRAGAMIPEQGSAHDSHSIKGSSRKAAFKSVRSMTLPNRIDENEQVNVTSPRAKTSMRSVRSHASAISTRHSVAGSHLSKRQPSADTIDSSDDENLLLTVSKNCKRTLRRRWNSNDIRTVQELYEDLDQYYETLIRREQELQRQREEIQMMVRGLAPVSRADGLRTAMFPAEQQDVVDTGINLDGVRSTRAPSAASTKMPLAQSYAPSIAGAVSPVRTTTSSHKEKRMSKASSRAKLDAASAALDNVIKERPRPVSDLSTTSATTDLSRGSRSSQSNSAAEGSMTDPFEYDAGPAKAAALAAKGANRGLAIHGHTLSGTLSLEQLHPSRPHRRFTAGIVFGEPRANAPLHMPPPVAKVIPRRTLSEEEEEDRQDGLLKTTVPELGVGLGKGTLRSASALSSQSRGSGRRLSVNHVFTRTEEMDRMLSVISTLDR